MDLPHCRADIGHGAGRTAFPVHAAAIAAQEPGKGDSGGGYGVSVLHDAAGDWIRDAMVLSGVRGGAVLNMERNMEKLLALIAEAGDEEDVVIRLSEAKWLGTSLQLHLAVTILDSAPETWKVRCEDVLVYTLRDESANWLELTGDHPVLWEFKQETASAYFYQAPVNADAAVGALYEAHQNAVGSWIRFGQHLNSPPGLSRLLAAGSGLLAEGPVSLLSLYKETLHRFGVTIDIRFTRSPQIWNGERWRQLAPENDMKALLLGTSYVVGSGWDAKQSV